MMKKTFLLVLITLLAINSANAQFEKGRKMLYGEVSGLSFTRMEDSGDSATQFKLGFGGATFIDDKFALDGIIGFQVQDQDGENLRDFNIGIGLRGYLYQGLYAGIGYEMLFRRYDGGYWEAATATAGFITPQIGVTCMVSEHIFLEPSIGYAIGVTGDIKDASIFGFALSVGYLF